MAGRPSGAVFLGVPPSGKLSAGLGALFGGRGTVGHSRRPASLQSGKSKSEAIWRAAFICDRTISGRGSASADDRNGCAENSFRDGATGGRRRTSGSVACV